VSAEERLGRLYLVGPKVWPPLCILDLGAVSPPTLKGAPTIWRAGGAR